MTIKRWCENLTLTEIQLETEQLEELGKHAHEIAKILKPLYETEKKTQKPILSEANYRRVFEVERRRHPEIYYNYSDGEVRIETAPSKDGYQVRICNWRKAKAGEKEKSGWICREFETLEKAIHQMKLEIIEYVSETVV